MKLASVRVFSCKHPGPLPSDARIQSGTATIRGLGLTLENTPTAVRPLSPTALRRLSHEVRVFMREDCLLAELR